jgi:hypothetical protein
MAYKKRIGPLNSAENISHEMQKVYRQLRRNELDASYAKSLIWVLSQIVQVHRDSDIEKRLEAVEEHL